MWRASAVTEIRIRTADGRYRTFSWTAISDGRLWYSLGIDITAMRADTELVRRLAAIVAHSDDAIVSTDRHAAITSWNAGAERLYGYCVAEIIGRPAHLLVPPDLRGEEAEVLA